MYASSADLVAAYGQDTVTRLSTAGGDATGDATVQAALDYAGALIDAQLSARFILPLETIPQVLLDVAVDLAIERMANSADLSTEIMLDRAKRARGDLKAIAEGRMNLGLPPLVAGESPRPVLARLTPGVDRLMTRRSLREL